MLTMITLTATDAERGDLAQHILWVVAKGVALTIRLPFRDHRVRMLEG